MVLIAPEEESELFDLDLLEINIQQQPKASTVPYVALSYTWGDAIDKVSLAVRSVTCIVSG